MTAFEDIKPGARLRGLDASGVAEVVQVSHFGPDALNLVFRVAGRVGERLVYRGEETAFDLIETGRAYSFDADGGLLRLASEAYRIRLAHLFDPYLAISASQIEALPHQITAVYGEMLPRQPLRFLLADDPGAGKTIMAGLLIKELLIRGDLERCLIVAPGSLVEQWQDEMAEKFGLTFDLLTRDQIEASVTGNPFVERDRLVLRLDMAARSDDLKAKLAAAPDWDLIICDEAHRMAASYFGGEVKETQRHKFGKLLGTRTRNFLLMSATPHNGKEADFQLFMGLLDADRFEGRFREGVHKADVSDMMRRLTKEELYRFDGTPLFPERRAYTASYSLSPAEADLYQAVTTYVREEMNRADRSADDKRRMNVGFALQILQRRLASSPAAIYRSVERRRKRLEERLREERLLRQGGPAPLSREVVLPTYDPDDIDEVPGAEAEEEEEQILDQATAAQTLAELEAEIVILRDLEERALRLKLSGEDAKWKQLESILNEPIMVDPATGLRRKIIIFTEPRDTLDYLQDKIVSRLGDPAAVVVIHGGIAREARRASIAAFNSDPVVRVMIANDAAGEGVNLQRGAHLMVNYDLPWNPNRLEQRFGRIHRIGQTEVCHLWNLCAANTREGEVYRRLLEKLEEAREALGGRVYDVLGELFEGHALRDLLVDAIRYGDAPETKRRLFQKVDNAACRAVLFAQLVDDPSSWPDHFPTGEAQEAERKRLHRVIERLVPWEASNNEAILNEARWEIARSVAWGLGEDPPSKGDGKAILDYLQAKAPPVYDPFSGGGSIPLEAQRLGLRAYGSDLNPVAVLIGKALVEIPSKFAGLPPINPNAQAELKCGAKWNGKGAQGLSEDVRYYGQWMRDQAQKRIGHLYPKATLPDGSEATVIAWIWARTVRSPDPATKGAMVPLVSSFMLSTKESKKAWIEPLVDPSAPDGYRFEVRTGPLSKNDEARFREGTIGRGAGGTCILSGASMPFSYVRREGQSNGLGVRLMAIVAESPRGRIYLSPTPEHSNIAASARPRWFPEGDLPNNPRNFNTPIYGLTTFSSLFTSRQLAAMTTFTDLVSEAGEQALRDSIAAGLDTAGTKLHLGGTGAQAYADALATYLAFAVSKASTRSCSLAIWEPGMGRLAGAIGRQAVPMQWSFAETNPLAGAGGDIAGTANSVAEIFNTSDFQPRALLKILQRREIHFTQHPS